MNGSFVGTIGGNTPTGGLSNIRGLRFIDGTVCAVNADTANGAPGAAVVRISPQSTIDPNRLPDNTDYTLVQGLVNGGWISPANRAPIPEPSTWLLMAGGLIGLLSVKRRQAARASPR